MKNLEEQIKDIAKEQITQKEAVAKQDLINLEIALNIEYLKCLKEVEA